MIVENIDYTYVSICRKLSELHFNVSMISNRREKVFKYNKILVPKISYFLVPFIGEQRYIQMQF